MGDAFLPAVIDASIRVGIAVAAVEWGTRRVRRSAPAIAHRLWLLVLSMALALPIGSALVRPVAYVHPAGTLALLLPESVSYPPTLVRVLAGVYMAGTLILLARLAIGLHLVALLVRRARPLAPSDVSQLASSSDGSSRARRVEFLETSSISIPVTTGFARPRVLLPAEWREWPIDRLRAVVRHERAHVDRGDYVAGLVSAFIQAALWFHPAIWLAGRRLSLCAELACDLRASDGAPADVYARHLLALEQGRSPFMPVWSVGAGTRLAERIAALLEPNSSESRSPRRRVIACCALIAALLAATPLRIVPLRWRSAHASIPYGVPAHQLHSHSH